MASSINASTSGAGGVITTADNTGILNLQTASTTAVTVDASQNVGIGTASPSKKLDVNGEAKITTGMTLTPATSSLYATDSTLSSYATDNAVYLNGHNTGWLQLQASGTQACFIQLFGASHADPNRITFRTSSTERMSVTSNGSLILVGSTAQKATGTTWSNPSDQRLKDNIRDYTKGTNELMQVRVREWEYNGKGNTTEGMKGLGVVADEVMTILPNTVETYEAKLNADDEETTAIKKFDATEITWLLVKTVQEQQTIINDLKARVTALEGATL